ncbi:MAG: ATP-binding protein [Crocinitomicaceae bacterium]|jgi:signal transduction histidine kinase/FixJ family two-component response regulator|nr:ATP-binding protein [Crocinitomicaceae bacterium]
MKKDNFIKKALHQLRSMRISKTYEYRLITLLVALLAFVIIAGGAIFYQLNTVAENVRLDRSSEKSLLLIKDIQSDFILAENRVNAYALSQQDTFLRAYNQIINRTYERIEALKVSTENKVKQESLVQDLLEYADLKYEILDSMLVVQNQFRVTDAMKKVAQEVREVNRSQKIISSLPQPQTKKSLREKIFGKKGKEETAPVMNPTDTGIDNLNREIQAISNNETSKERKNNEILFELQSESKIISLRLSSTLNFLETNILTELEMDAQAANNSAVTLSYFLMVFSLLVAVLIGVTLYTIFSYIQTNNRSKKQLQTAKIQSEELAATKERFLANMSHEIRTPLNAISGFAHLLSKEKLPETQREKLNIIEESSKHLIGLINQILDLTKLQSNKLPVEKVSFQLSNELNWIANVLQTELTKRKNQFHIQIEENVPDHLLGDPMKLKQIVLNLCSNAVKFTENANVYLQIQSIQKAKEKLELRIRVKDEGIGIPPDKQASIFDEFEQAEKSTQRKFGGTGVGLSITKKLVELLGGSIELKSEMGKGTTITVLLPFEVGSEDALAQEEIAHTEISYLQGKNILVVDDEPFNRKLLVTLLHQHNIYTEEAENGKEAIEKIENEHFDLVFMDLRMPEMDGKMATRIIRSELKKSKEELIVIALTANTQLLDDHECDKNGFNACMQKPFTESKLIEILNLPIKTPEEEQKEYQNGLYNLSNLKNLSAGDESFFQEMVETFMLSTAKSMDELTELKNDFDFDKIADLAHKMASPCTHLEANTMHQALKQIESMARAKTNQVKIEEEISFLEGHVKEILTAMETETGIELKKLRTKK